MRLALAQAEAAALRGEVPIGAVLVAADGKAALEILKRERLDVLITDIRMPEMTGVEFLEKIILNFRIQYV